MWRSFLFSSLSCVRRLSLCSLKASKSCENETFGTCSQPQFGRPWNFADRLFQCTSFSFSNFLTDWSRADWRDFTLASLLTASTSRANLKVENKCKIALICASVFLCAILEINLSMPCWRMSQFLKRVKREEARLQKLKWRMHRCTELFLPSVYKRGEAHNWNRQITEEGVPKLIVCIYNSFQLFKMIKPSGLHCHCD